MPTILERLYESEINASISTFYDAGYTAKLGDDLNGITVQTTRPTYAEAERWLEEQATELYPNSLFVRLADRS